MIFVSARRGPTYVFDCFCEEALYKILWFVKMSGEKEEGRERGEERRKRGGRDGGENVPGSLHNS